MELVRKLQELIKEVQKYVDEQAKAHKKVRRRRGQAVGTRCCGNLIASPACVTWDFLWTAVRPFKESLHLLFSSPRCFGLAFSSLKWKNLTSLTWCQPSKKGSLIVDFILRNMHGVILRSAFFLHLALSPLAAKPHPQLVSHACSLRRQSNSGAWNYRSRVGAHSETERLSHLLSVTPLHPRFLPALWAWANLQIQCVL